MILRSISSAILVQTFQNESGIVAVATETVDERVVAFYILRGGGKPQAVAGGVESGGGRDRTLAERQAGGQRAQCAGSAQGFSKSCFRTADRALLQARSQSVP